MGDTEQHFTIPPGGAFNRVREMQVPLLDEKPDAEEAKHQSPEDTSRLLMWVFRMFGLLNILTCLLVDVANITSVIKFSSLNCPSKQCGYGPISSPILEVASDSTSVILSILGVWFLLVRYHIRTVKPNLSFIRSWHNRIGKVGWWTAMSTAIVIYMNYFVFYDSTSDSSTEEWLKAVEYASKSLSAVTISVFIWVLHNICVTHCLHYEGKILFALCTCLFLPKLSDVIFYVVVGVIQANQADSSVAASWIFFFMLASLASLVFTYLLKPSKIEEWRATLRLLRQVSVVSDYTPRFQKRLNSSMSNQPLILPQPINAPIPPPSSHATSNSLVSNSLPIHGATSMERRRASIGEVRRGSIDDSAIDELKGGYEQILAARNAAEEAVHKTEALAQDMRMLKASTAFARAPDHDQKDKAAVDLLRKELRRIEESVQAQTRKLARLEAQLKESEDRQLEAIKAAQAEAQTNVAEMTEQLEKLEAFVVSTSKMVSEAVKPKESGWWGN